MPNQLVDVPRAQATLLDREWTRKMSLNRALKAGDIDTAEALSKGYDTSIAQEEKIKKLKTAAENELMDEATLTKKLIKELEDVQPNADPYEQVSKLTHSQKSRLLSALPVLKGKFD